MPQPEQITVFSKSIPRQLDPEVQALFDKCLEKIGFVPNVFAAYAAKPKRLDNFRAMFNELMLAPSGLSKLEREMVAVVVSSANHCYYCLVAHGQAVRHLSGDPELGEMMAMNYKVAHLDARQRAMLDYAWKLTLTPSEITDADRQQLKAVGLSEDDIFDLSEVAAFFNFTNRVASGLEQIPNREYHGLDRPTPFAGPSA
ncbi:MAG: alkylhydroperoxidase [Nevskiaceae bacterium]|nr:MAG: alkylhydroperoxidase [Nevskiaceae bacterium]TBR71523.1 MAG: alkylhydroperoxidase [Nevskiaceae bacterium]